MCVEILKEVFLRSVTLSLRSTLLLRPQRHIVTNLLHCGQQFRGLAVRLQKGSPRMLMSLAFRLPTNLTDLLSCRPRPGWWLGYRCGHCRITGSADGSVSMHCIGRRKAAGFWEGRGVHETTLVGVCITSTPRPSTEKLKAAVQRHTLNAGCKSLDHVSILGTKTTLWIA